MMRGDLTDDIIRFSKRFVHRAPSEMSIFPTKIVLATDGSSEAELASQTAVELAQMCDSVARSFALEREPQLGTQLELVLKDLSRKPPSYDLEPCLRLFWRIRPKQGALLDLWIGGGQQCTTRISTSSAPQEGSRRR
jgi:hypothetical protein